MDELWSGLDTLRVRGSGLIVCSDALLGSDSKDKVNNSSSEVNFN
mgnify:CR=1 FL=1